MEANTKPKVLAVSPDDSFSPLWWGHSGENWPCVELVTPWRYTPPCTFGGLPFFLFLPQIQLKVPLSRDCMMYSPDEFASPLRISHISLYPKTNFHFPDQSQ